MEPDVLPDVVTDMVLVLPPIPFGVHQEGQSFSPIRHSENVPVMVMVSVEPEALNVMLEGLTLTAVAADCVTVQVFTVPVVGVQVIVAVLLDEVLVLFPIVTVMVALPVPLEGDTSHQDLFEERVQPIEDTSETSIP